MYLDSLYSYNHVIITVAVEIIFLTVIVFEIVAIPALFSQFVLCCRKFMSLVHFFFLVVRACWTKQNMSGSCSAVSDHQ